MQVTLSGVYSDLFVCLVNSFQNSGLVFLHWLTFSFSWMGRRKVNFNCSHQKGSIVNLFHFRISYHLAHCLERNEHLSWNNTKHWRIQEALRTSPTPLSPISFIVLEFWQKFGTTTYGVSVLRPIWKILNPPLLQETVWRPIHAERMDYIVFLQNGE